MRLQLAAWCLAATGVVGCHAQDKAAEAQKQQEAQIETRAQQLAVTVAADLEARRQAEELAHRAAQEKADRETLQLSPKDFFEVSGLQVDNEGIGDLLRSVSRLTLTNQTRFTITQVDVRVDFMKDGAPAASIPLSLKGALPAGGTRTFSVSDDTLSGAAVKTPSSQTQVVIVSATVDEQPTAAVP
jgi:hypothetical protein